MGASMQSATQLIDLTFGINQLSGNKSLLFTLLQRFSDEYAQSDAKLQSHFAEGEWEKARVFIHTLKGVAGNLGLVALHEQSKLAELALKNDEDVPPSYADFIVTLDATLAEITQLANSGEDNTNTATADSGTQASALVSALENNEFIPQQQLDEWLDALPLNADSKSEISEAIDELDYDKALSLLNA